MRRRRAPAGRATFALLAVVALGLALVLFPLRFRAGARAAGAASTGQSSRGEGPSAGPRSGAAASSAAASPSGSTSASASGSATATASGGRDQPSGAPSDASVEARTIPTGHGLPVIVGTAVFFLEVKSFDDTKGEFECTTDLRFRWSDLRLRYPVSTTYKGYKEWRGKDAEEELGRIWSPTVDVTNRLETLGYVGHRLRIFPDGAVELITRATARYKTHVDPQRFPFDRQYLLLDLLVREETTDEVALRFHKEDVEFSRAAHDMKLDGWKAGHVDLRAEIVAGWNGDRYSRVTAALLVDRLPTTGLAPIFIPLMASLLIPLLAIWMNRANRDGFEVEAFELANMGIGGLFSVIALSFAIYSSFGVLAGSDNTVTRLFGLNYATLALSLAIVVMLFRYDLARRWFGPYVHVQLFKFIAWALPVLTLGTSIAFLLAAAA